MNTENLNIVVSWTGADDRDTACYCIGLYDGEKPDTLDMAIVDDTDCPDDHAKIAMVISEFETAYGMAAGEIPVNYDI